jgi:hypothetical protein
VPARLRRRILLGVAFVAAIVVLRGRALFTPYSDPTTGLYLHIARAWLHGELPYTTTWDYRPPGYFALYALAMSVVGAPVARDALAVVSLAATALAVAFIANAIDVRRGNDVGVWAAAFFVMLSPVNDGIAGVAELQISAFIAWSISLALARPATLTRTALVGLLAGCALQCKLSAVPLAIVPAILVATRSAEILRTVVAFVAGFALPIVADVALYARANELPALWNANVGSTIRRAQSANGGDEFARNRVNFERQFLALAPQVELAAFALMARANASRVASVGWLVAALLSIVAAGEFYERQFVLLTAPVAILGAIGFTNLRDKIAARGARRWAAIVTVLVTFALHDYFETNQTIAYGLHRIVLHDRTWRLDQTAQAYAALACLPRNAGELFLLEQNPYLYDLLDQPSPTKYAYSDHLLDPRLSIMANIDGDAELTRVLQTNPQYIVVSSLNDFRYGAERTARVRTALATRYRLAYRTPQFRVYRYRFTQQPATRLPCSEIATSQKHPRDAAPR